LAGTFNNSIVTSAVTELGKIKLNPKDPPPKYVHFVRLLHTQVLCYRVICRLGPDSLDVAGEHRLVRGLSMIVNKLVPRLSTLSDDTVKDLRSQYARKVCDALRSIGYERYNKLLSEIYTYNKDFFDSVVLQECRVCLKEKDSILATTNCLWPC
jgi:hypothetical protein